VSLKKLYEDSANSKPKTNSISLSVDYSITVRDRMFWRMQNQISPQFCPNLTIFAKKKIAKLAFPAPTALD